MSNLSKRCDISLRSIVVRAQVHADRIIASKEKMVPSYATRLLRLTFLAPDIIGAILDGEHPAELTAQNKPMADTRLPLDWRERRAALGFA